MKHTLTQGDRETMAAQLTGQYLDAPKSVRDALAETICWLVGIEMIESLDRRRW